MQEWYLSLLISMQLLLVGCDSWPPHKDEVSDNFAKNQESFRALGAKFIASDYTSVYSTTGDAAIGVIDGDNGPERELISDDPEWVSLFAKTSVSRVLKKEYSIVFVPPAPHSKDGRDTEISYAYFSSGDSNLFECEPRFEALECGVCGIKLAEDWWIDYMWYPMPILESESQMYLDGTLAEDKYFELQGAAYADCQITGLKEIGYETE